MLGSVLELLTPIQVLYYKLVSLKLAILLETLVEGLLIDAGNFLDELRSKQLNKIGDNQELEVAARDNAIYS